MSVLLALVDLSSIIFQKQSVDGDMSKVRITNPDIRGAQVMINMKVQPQADVTIVVDGMNEFYKNYFKLKGSIGEFSAAFYGVTRCAMSYLKMGSKVIIIWEGRSKKRKAENTEYKANREKMPSTFYDQLDDTRKFLAHFFTEYMVDDYEADDMMAYIAIKRSQQGKKTIIVTNDDDLHQVISDNISVYSASKKIMYTPVNMKYKMEPNKLLALWGIEGDGSDNIIGVKGVRNREELVEKYFDNDKLYISEEELKKRFAEFVFEIQANNEKNADIIVENYDKILMNMNLIRLREVPKENYRKIEIYKEPTYYIEKYKCKSFYQYISQGGGLI